MEKLEKVELVREKAGVTFEEARNALEACDYDVLDAIVWLERAGKVDMPKTARYATTAGQAGPVSPEMEQAQTEYREQSRKTKFGETWDKFRYQARSIIRAGFDMTFIAERHGDRVVALPLILVIIGLLAWGASLWLLIIGLFFGFRYRIEGANPVTFDVNDAMDKAAGMAESLKRDFTKDNETNE